MINIPKIDLTDHNWIARNIDLGKEILYLTQKEVIDMDLTIEDILKITEQALIAHGRKKYEMPAKIGIHPLPEVFFHAMPAYVPDMNACGMKWIECFPYNPQRFNLPQTTGLLILNDSSSGVPVVIMDSTWITAVRTPAVTVLAAAALHPDAENFGMFGCGVQGIGHVKFVVHTLKKLKKIYVYDINGDAMDNLISICQPEIDIPIVKGTPEQIAKSCEVMSSATIIIKESFGTVKDEWISKGQTILPCDLNTFWDPITQRRADKYIVDSIEEHELFARVGYFPDGLPQIYCETGEILAGVAKGRESKDELIVCSNIGMAVCDVALGREIFNRALDKDIGRKLPL
jgi:ornithine cyclodeaminase/alanine dehydrogenase-like protein (mu-crystallin family)